MLVCAHPNKAAGPFTGLQNTAGQNAGSAFFMHIFRLLRLHAMSVGREDSSTERQPPQIDREKETFCKVFHKKSSGLLLGLSQEEYM